MKRVLIAVINIIALMTSPIWLPIYAVVIAYQNGELPSFLSGKHSFFEKGF